MRVRLKGLNSIRKRLADGTYRTYWYAWKGGPPLRGGPGTPEFTHSYNEACARKAAPPTGKLLHVLQQYQASDVFLSLADETRRGYVKLIVRIEHEFSDFPLAALTDKRTRGISWRGVTGLRCALAVKPTMLGPFWHAFCPGLSIAGSSPQIHVLAAAGSIAVHAQKRFGLLTTNPYSWRALRRTCTSH
jgi:hypothetical protein